jgi:hypothetical protein
MDELNLVDLIDKRFIAKYYPVLAILNKSQIKQYYIKKGEKKGMLLSNLHIRQIVQNEYFNIEFYQSQNQDLRSMSPIQLVNHYIDYGKREGRVVSKKHVSILTNNPEFDITVYKSQNPDLCNMDDIQLLQHYIDYGEREGRFCTKTSFIKICIIYIYYEIKNKQQNQNNLAFFIKYGLDKSRWKDMNITTLFVINGDKCEVLLPQTDDVHILFNSNPDNHNDDKSYQLGVDYFTNKYNDTIDSLFTHVCLINVSNFGPLSQDINMADHWIYQLITASSIDGNSTISNKIPVIDCNKTDIFGKYDATFLKDKLNYKNDIFDISNYNRLFYKINNKCIIYAHYDKDNIIKQYVLETLVMFAQLGYDILFYTTSTIITNYDEEYLPFKINYFPLNYGAGTDWYIWLDGCNKLKSQSYKYDWITLINDSMLIGINGIENMKETIDAMEHKNVDFWGHWDSNEIKYHIMSSFYVLKYKMIDYFILFCQQFLIPCKTKQEIILNCETKFTLFLKSGGFTTGVVIEENSLPHLNCHTPSHNPLNIDSWMNNKRAFGIKWKYVLEHLSDKHINNEFKERLRYMYLGKCIDVATIFNVK